ncbi:CHAT domain-containing protein [Streptomyces sp. NPDC020192]|uniref:CHAT domain-containing protein n=1 Tax=Streptomyces sp. NPDC020192 TaxID=3365066 RepID=UPI0037981887
MASHGSARIRPTVSALHLEGDLTVQRLLDRTESQQGADNGPLTLTTAFVAAGARDVAGSRGMARDGASALLMAVFHQCMNVDGLGPADALRAGQLWMPDPERENPGSLHGRLLREMRRPGLEHISLWARFIHQGHPGDQGHPGHPGLPEGERAERSTA